ncbi:hypothetical protein GCM10027562_37150 [Arthrobacter pigmenti]
MSVDQRSVPELELGFVQRFFRLRSDPAVDNQAPRLLKLSNGGVHMIIKKRGMVHIGGLEVRHRNVSAQQPLPEGYYALTGMCPF